MIDLCPLQPQGQHTIFVGIQEAFVTRGIGLIYARFAQYISVVLCRGRAMPIPLVFLSKSNDSVQLIRESSLMVEDAVMDGL